MRTINRIATSIIVLVFAAFFLLTGTKDFIDLKRLAAHGETTHAEIVRQSGSSDFFLFSSYYLLVRFKTAEETVCERRVRVTENSYTNARVGDPITVHYLPREPYICQAEDAEKMRYGSFFRGFIFMAWAAYLLVISPRSENNAAKKINKSVNTLALEKYEYVSVKAENFKHLDLSFYNRLQHFLESRGFVYLGDMENLTLRQRNGTNTMIRYLLGSDKTTIADIYHLLPKFSFRLFGYKSARVLDLTTWLSDGSFISTSNALGAAKFTYPPQISMLFLPASMTWDVMLETHERRVKKYIESHAEAQPIVLNGIEDIRHVFDEMQRIKSAFRKRHGLSKSELERLGVGKAFDIDEMHDALTECRERGLD